MSSQELDCYSHQSCNEHARFTLRPPPPNVPTSLCEHRDVDSRSTKDSQGEAAHHMLLNVLDYPTPKDALAAAADGDRVYFPGVAPYEAPPEGWQITKRIEVFGDGPVDPSGEGGTLLKPNPTPGAQRDVFQLVPDDHANLTNVEIRDLSIKGSGAPGTAVRYLASETKRLSDLRIKRVVITSMGSDGITLIGSRHPADAMDRLDGVSIAETEVSSCGGAGLKTELASRVHVQQSRFKSNAGGAVLASSTALIMHACDTDSNGTAPMPTEAREEPHK